MRNARKRRAKRLARKRGSRFEHHQWENISKTITYRPRGVFAAAWCGWCGGDCLEPEEHGLA